MYDGTQNFIDEIQGGFRKFSLFFLALNDVQQMFFLKVSDGLPILSRFIKCRVYPSETG